MARLGRAEVFSPDEIAICHVMSRVVRRCFFLGDDPVSGKNFDHRKLWIEEQLKRLSTCLGSICSVFRFFRIIFISCSGRDRMWWRSGTIPKWLAAGGCSVRFERTVQGERWNRANQN